MGGPLSQASDAGVPELSYRLHGSLYMGLPQPPEFLTAKCNTVGADLVVLFRRSASGDCRSRPGMARTSEVEPGGKVQGLPTETKAGLFVKRVLRTTVFGSAALAIAGVVGAFAMDWTEPTLLGSASTYPLEDHSRHRRFQIAVDGEAVYALWVSEEASLQGLVFAKSEDCGETWSAPRRLARVERRRLAIPSTALAVTGSDLHVFWLEGKHSPTRRYSIHYSRSPDGGSTWTSPVRLFGPRKGLRRLHASAQGNEVLLLAPFHTQPLVVATSDSRGRDWTVTRTRDFLKHVEAGP